MNILKHEDGFTLLETMVALVILSLAFATLLPTLGEAMIQITNRHQHALAIVEAQQILAMATPKDEETIETINVVSNNGFNSTIQFSPVQFNNTEYQQPINLYEISVKITWTIYGIDSYYIISTLRATPRKE